VRRPAPQVPPSRRLGLASLPLRWDGGSPSSKTKQMSKWSKYVLAPNDRWRAQGRIRDVFGKWSTVLIDFDGPVPEDVAKRADEVFKKLVPRLARSKIAEKRSDWRSIYHAIEKAAAREKCAVIFHRNRNHRDYRTIRIQLMTAAVEEQIVEPFKSKPGSPKASRYIPKIERPRVWVEVRDRETKQPLPVDWNHPVAIETQSKLDVVNTTNPEWKITIRPFDFRTEEYGGRRPIRPLHSAIFTDDFYHHGRIYGAHQQHGKEARATIRFGNSRSVELDFEGFHPRALYHWEGLNYSIDPYRLWDDTTPEMRLMAKQVINAALNAKSQKSTIDACNLAMSKKTKEGGWKTGKELQHAIKLRTAAQQTGLRFADIYDLARSRHQRIAKHFGSDVGMKLMRMDSKIALDVLFHFTRKGHPCLGIHDSFIVPESQEDELRRVMIAFYRRENDFAPVIQ
jgi:hypothetical protein